MVDDFWRTSMAAGPEGAHDCIERFSAVDFTADLHHIDVPVLVAHGDDDQIAPYANSAPETAELLENAELKTFPGARHGLCGEHEFDAHLLACARA